MKQKKRSTRILSLVLAAAMVGTLLPAMSITAAAAPPAEQFNLATGQTYYFDLSAEAGTITEGKSANIGEINTAVPDATLHYVPFTYAGTVNAYSLESKDNGNTSASTAATPSDRSLFVADYNISKSITWNALHTAELIFGKPFDTNYTLRSLSTGRTKNTNPLGGEPTNNEWDSILTKSGLADPIKNWSGCFSFGQDTASRGSTYRFLRGSTAAAGCINIECGDTGAFGFRPALEVLNPGTLTADGLKAVTLNLNGGSFDSNGSGADGVVTSLNIACAGGTFKAPSGEGLTPPSNRAFGKWTTKADGTGDSYAVGAAVPNSVTTLYAQWLLAISFDARTGVAIDAVEIGDAMTLPADPSWDGYTFGGWYDGIDGTDAAGGLDGALDLTKAKALTGTTKVYAKWIAPATGKTVYTQPIDFGAAGADLSGDGYVWNNASSTLTLDGATIDCSKNAHSPGNVFGIQLTPGSNIILAAGSTNTITAGTAEYNSAGICFNTMEKISSSISGTGTLKATGGTTTGEHGKSFGIENGDRTITVRDATIIAASAASPRGVGIITCLDIKSGTITATGSATGISGNKHLNKDPAFSMTGGLLSASGATFALSVTQAPITLGVGATITGATEKLTSSSHSLIQKEQGVPVVISFGPSITVAAQTGNATYGTVASSTYTVTSNSFGESYPAFAPSVVWTSGSAPTGVTAAFSAGNGTLTMTTDAATPAGEYKFKVVSAKAAGETGNYESAEATLTVDKLEATIAWTGDSFTYNGSSQAPTATVSNKVGDDVVTVTVTGGQANVGTNITATADALAGAAASNYKLPTTQPTTTFAITAKTVTVNDGTLEVKKAFDNSTTAGTVTSGKLGLTNVVVADTANVSVKVDIVGAYADVNVGKNKTVTLTISLEGSAASNYTLGSVTNYEFTKAEITKTAYAGTAATAPDSTPTTKGDKSITIAPVTPPDGENVEYAVSKTNTPPTSDKDWQPGTTFDNLDPNTEYFFFARVKENDSHAPGGVSSPGTSITTDKSEYTTKPTKPDGTPESKSDTSITLKTVTAPDGETLEYGIDKDNDGNITWQDELTFSGLNPNKEYKFYTRVKESNTHKAGPESDATPIKTNKSAYSGTQATTPVLSSKNDTAVTLTTQNVTDQTVEYGYSATADGEITWQDSHVFTGLTASTDYYFSARVKENDTHAAGTTSAKATIKTDKVAYTGTQTTAPVAESKTHTSITLKTQDITGETVQYGKSTTANGTITWQDTVTFSSLTAGTDYYFYTRVKETDDHKAGITSAGVIIKTAASTATIGGTVKDNKDVVVNAATVKIMNGQTEIAATKTNATGEYTFTNIAYGTYSLVVEKDSIKVTKTITIAAASDTVNIKLPDGKQNTVVETKPNTPSTAADGLNELFSSAKVGENEDNTKGITKTDLNTVTNGGSVTVTLTSTQKTEAEVQAAADAIKNEAPGEELLFLDFAVTKVVTPKDGTAGAPITMTELPAVVEIVVEIPEALRNAATISVYRTHNNVTTKFATTADANGEYAERKGNYMHVFAKYFSTYALGCTAHDVTIADGGAGASGAGSYAEGAQVTINAGTKSGYSFNGWTVTPNTVVIANPSSVSTTFIMPATPVTVTAGWTYTGGDGSATITYPNTVNKPQNGTVTTNPASPSKGQTVTITTKPDAGYVVDTIIVKDADGKTIAVTKNGENSYSFVQPGNKVTVEVTYKKLGTKTFTDVTANDWFYNAVMEATANGWFSGTSATTFDPYASTTRGMIATVLQRVDSTPKATTASFDDVAPDAYYASGIAWAQANNIVVGYGNGNYGPNDNITREQLAAILYRYSGYKGYDVSKRATLDSFTDGKNVSDYAKEAMSWAVGSGLISGRGNNILAPTATATRAEVAAILVRFDELFTK